MINKLKKRIRLIVQIPLILLMILISAVSLYVNYNNLMSEASETINRMSAILDEHTGGDKGNNAAPPKKSGNADPNSLKENDQSDGSPADSGEMEGGKPPVDKNDKNGATVDSAAVAEGRNTSDNGDILYEFIIRDGEITYQSTTDPDITALAQSLAQGVERKGIKSGLFYRVRKTSGKEYIVRMLHSDSLYRQLVNTCIIITVSLLLSILLIILISFLLSKVIIKPVIKNEEKQKAFISDTSHELKTPLAVISVNADMLENEVGKDNKWLGYIQTEVSGMEKLIAGLMLLLSSESNDKNGTDAEFDLSEKTEMCVTVFEASAYEKGVSLKTAIVPDIRFVGCEDDIEHIVAPLVDNAVKHTEKGGNVLFMLTEEKGEAIISVQNEGEPIPEEDREKIFDRFYRVDKARNRSENRYGLGLPIVKSPAEKYGGRVTVKCENGLTTFTVRLKSHKKPS